MKRSREVPMSNKDVVAARYGKAIRFEPNIGMPGLLNAPGAGG